MMIRRRSVAPEITLHLGAHRTGTTRLQKTLDGNRDLLLEERILPLTPPYLGVRKERSIRAFAEAVHDISRSRSFWRRHQRARKARSQLSELIDAPARYRRIILSEEELLGHIFDRSTGIGIYGDADKHLRHVRRFLDGRVTEICLGIRSYDAFLVSAYAMTVLYGKTPRTPPFEDIWERYISLDFGWTELIRTIRSIFPEVPVRLWRYETLGLRAQLGLVLGEKLASRIALGGDAVINERPSADAIRFALQLDSIDTLDPDDVIHRFRSGARFDPLEPKEKDALSRRYVEDLEEISKLSGVFLDQG